jgi:hypothetical protein
VVVDGGGVGPLLAPPLFREKCIFTPQVCGNCKNTSLFGIIAKISQDHSLNIDTLSRRVPSWTDLDVVEVILQFPET